LLEELEELLKGHSSMMSVPTEGIVDRVIKYGAVFAQVSAPRWQQREIDTF